MKLGLFIAFIIIVSAIGYLVWDKYINTFKVIEYDDGTKIVVPTKGKPITLKGILLPQLDIDVINQAKRDLAKEIVLDVPIITIQDF